MPDEVATQEEKIKSAEELSQHQKAISISEFFEKNRHLLGYDNKTKALMIIVKEGVDNSLDACEEARILPDITVKIEELEKEKYKIIIKDNGPGIVKKQIPKIFGTLLYGSKFHRLRQSRGQQGLGISCGVLYSQLTTGEATEIASSTGKEEIHKYTLKIDVKKNEPVILNEKSEANPHKWRGTRISFVAEGIYREHKQSVLEYLKETAISNPFANFIFESPSGKLEFRRGVEKLPIIPKEIKPHLYGVEVGLFTRMLNETSARSISGFLTTEFSRIGATTATEILKKAQIDPKISPRRTTDENIVNIVKAVKEVKLSKPPTDCLSPLGEKAITKGLQKELSPDFVASVTRSPAVYRGWPFQIEVGIAFGGTIAEANFMRFANRVPLLYQQGSCALTRSAASVDWKRYGLDADKLPKGPIVLMVHICSVWVPFTSESKEAVASYPIIVKETKLAFQDAARKLSLYLSGIRRAERIAERKRIFERYAIETARALQELTGEDEKKIKGMIATVVEKRWGEVVDSPSGNGPTDGD
ncbi:MAG: DNA topoisomerase VI subunit B [Nanoarchaeota archaeon]|nr:DNA topoisomerase VI subunit B [Nanoarchaeota archaeon]